MKKLWLAVGILVIWAVVAAAQESEPKETVHLPSSKDLLEPVPGHPLKTNSLPMAIAFSPDGRYAAVVNAGFGTYESNYDQSIAVLDLTTGSLGDWPDARTGVRAKQTLYSGLAFSKDGKHLYASVGSITSPGGTGKDETGDAIAVYGFDGGAVKPERLIPVGLQSLAEGKTQNQLDHPLAKGKAIPFPTGLTVVAGAEGGERILVADNLSDDALLIDAGTGKVIYRFDLSDAATVPASFPIAVTATRDGRVGYVALWNGSAVAKLDLSSGRVVETLPLLKPNPPVAPSSHPAALVLSPDEKTLYVALANRDMVAAVEVSKPAMKIEALLDTKLPGQSYFGAVPNALALSEDGERLYVADASSDAVAVFDTKAARAKKSAKAVVMPLGFIPTEWYPTALGVRGGQLFIATGKGRGTGPNAEPQRMVPGADKRLARPRTYIGTLLHGSLATVDRVKAESELKQLTAEVVESNRMKAAEEKIAFAGGKNPIRHVIYIIKENRTYDQVLGDLGAGDGDAKLTMYGRETTPNEHKLAEQFGVLDNFFDSGEVSGDGHVWSNAAVTSDYTEKTWQQSYRGGERLYDFEGVVAQGYPLLEGIPDINEPASGYLWTNLAKHGKSYYHFGEYVSTKFCDDSGEAPKEQSPLAGTPQAAPELCRVNHIHLGEAIPENYGGGKSRYPWAIPLVAKNVATKPELVGHFDPEYPDFNLSFPDQLRVEEFLTHFHRWVEARKAGRDEMPEFVMLRLGNDHTAGTRPGAARPKASVADNDLAVGRAVEAVSHSEFWEDTAFFILEDDAQDGADHVDAHRSLMLAVSKYAPRKADGPVVDHTFYTTVSTIRTMESLLGLPPMNNNDAFAPLMAKEFTGAGDQPAFAADYSNRDNGLIYEANEKTAPGAKESSRMDFRHADKADPQKLNVILWKDAMGDKPIPAVLMRRHAKRKDGDD